MTTRTELLEIINNGENSGVEFKRDVIENHALAKELVRRILVSLNARRCSVRAKIKKSRQH